ncbi:MAG: DUF835 domain-containing protein, partial [Thermoplasmata archaeon]|nr:DUF835 domain-containing protein [Thermoplasmata archaeon]
LPCMVEVIEALPPGIVPIPWAHGDLLVTLPADLPGRGDTAPPPLTPDGFRLLHALRRRLDRSTAPSAIDRVVLFAAGSLGEELARHAAAISRYLQGLEIVLAEEPGAFVTQETTNGRTRRGERWAIWIPGLAVPTNARRKPARVRRARARATGRPIGADMDVDFLDDALRARETAIREAVESFDHALGRPLIGPAKLARAWETGLTSFDAVAHASYEQLAVVPGFGPVLAATIVRGFGGVPPPRVRVIRPAEAESLAPALEPDLPAVLLRSQPAPSVRESSTQRAALTPELARTPEVGSNVPAPTRILEAVPSVDEPEIVTDAEDAPPPLAAAVLSEPSTAQEPEPPPVTWDDPAAPIDPASLPSSLEEASAALPPASTTEMPDVAEPAPPSGPVVVGSAEPGPESTPSLPTDVSGTNEPGAPFTLPEEMIAAPETSNESATLLSHPEPDASEASAATEVPEAVPVAHPDVADDLSTIGPTEPRPSSEPEGRQTEPSVARVPEAEAPLEPAPRSVVSAEPAADSDLDLPSSAPPVPPSVGPTAPTVPAASPPPIGEVLAAASAAPSPPPPPTGVEVWAESTAERPWSAFLDLTDAGNPGLCLSREFPERLRTALGSRNVRVVWLSNVGREGSIRPGDLESLRALFRTFLGAGPGRTAYFEGVEYLVRIHGSARTVEFLHELHGLARESSARLILPINPALMDPSSAEQLTAEFSAGQ